MKKKLIFTAYHLAGKVGQHKASTFCVMLPFNYNFYLFIPKQVGSGHSFKK